MFRRFLSLDKRLLLAIGVFLGIAFTVGFSTSIHATDTADFCATCHVMAPEYESFIDSTHAHLNCNDCHAPTDNYAKKLLFKAEAGFHDIYMNTFKSDEIPEVIHATAASEEVINNNCISCHQSTLQDVSHDAKDSCTDCHRFVPHGKGNFKSPEWFKPKE